MKYKYVVLFFAWNLILVTLLYGQVSKPDLKNKNSTKPMVTTILPRDKYGLPDWAEAIRSGMILPKASLEDEDVEEEMIDMLVLIKAKLKFMPNVLFPHSIHTYWLNCDNCHPNIFKMKREGNPEMTMWKIFRGEYCGRCHNKVAFALTECYRCHIKRVKKAVLPLQKVKAIQ